MDNQRITVETVVRKPIGQVWEKLTLRGRQSLITLRGILKKFRFKKIIKYYAAEVLQASGGIFVKIQL